ncbi:DUF423 domain-containing protein [Paradesertivirga mongoliensis]|uniref:DUF423 domain-containing protein n=1 Tax=Paradesertivirga mongoliensis TaxID=2100740 RepID=A0ABW4ZR98_9SPHI|nr:DUF423 domain-containing protein [Pedobacter mongoliensis]
MNRQIIITASIFGLSAVILGAFGAHALKESLSPSSLESWKTAVSYQFYHTLALLFLSNFSKYRSRSIRFAYWSFTLGMLIFSGSIYLLSTTELSKINFSFLGPVTPLGGLLLILGWLFLLFAALKNK